MALTIAWKPLEGPTGAKAMARLGEVLGSWERTPYMVSQQAKGRDGGVDCVRFVCGVMDELRGTQTPIETLPQDAAMHNRQSAIMAMHRIGKLFQPNDLIQPTDATWWAEPGDLAVTSPKGGGPGHAMIVGQARNVLWESSGSGVRKVGLGTVLLPNGPWRLSYVFRPLDKSDWGK
jgi:hypothetical protein